MVSNYDRIYKEIVKRARAAAGETGVDPDALVTLVMEIVDLEDQHRIRHININQLFQEKIQAAALNQAIAGD